MNFQLYTIETFMPGNIPAKQNKAVGLDVKERSIQLSATICQARIDKWDDNGGKQFGWRAGDVTTVIKED